MLINSCDFNNIFFHFFPIETGGLFNMAIRLMQLFSDSKEDYVSLVSMLGLYFQIRDDYCNLCVKEVSF